VRHHSRVSLSHSERAAIAVAASVAALVSGAGILAEPVSGAERASASKAPSASGTVYIESNSAARDSNEILAFRYRNGVLSAQGIRPYPTGGSGSHDLSNSGVLDADQELIVNSIRTLLFAVNSSSDTIAIFHIHADGSLVPVVGSPFPSNGYAPTSLGLAGRTLIVANKAQDGVRNLSHVRPNYTSFHVRSDGSLSRPISTIAVPPRSSPLQAYVTPDGKVLISSEESGVFRAFRIAPDGRLRQALGSPVRMPTAVFPGGRRVPDVWPAGLVSNPHLKILYAQLANLSETIVYRWNDQGRLTFVRALPNPHSFLPCWTHVNASGTRMYSGNAGSDNLTVFDIAHDPTNPRAIQSVRLNAPGNPWNFQIDPTGRVIFLLDMRATRQIPPGRGNQLHALRIAADGRLTEERASPINIPVPIGTNPVGLAIVPNDD